MNSFIFHILQINLLLFFDFINFFIELCVLGFSSLSVAIFEIHYGAVAAGADYANK